MEPQIYSNYAKLRDEQHLTDYAVSKRTKINRGAISQWKSGKQKPSYNSLEKLAKFFKVPVKYFYEG